MQTLKQLVARVDPGGGAFKVGALGDGGFVQYVRMRADARDPSGAPVLCRGRKWYVSKYATEQEVFRTCLLAVQTFEVHELYERFRVDGELLLDPHPEGPRVEGVKMWEEV